MKNKSNVISKIILTIVSFAPLAFSPVFESLGAAAVLISSACRLVYLDIKMDIKKYEEKKHAIMALREEFTNHFEREGCTDENFSLGGKQGLIEQLKEFYNPVVIDGICEDARLAARSRELRQNEKVWITELPETNCRNDMAAGSCQSSPEELRQRIREILKEPFESQKQQDDRLQWVLLYFNTKLEKDLIRDILIEEIKLADTSGDMLYRPTIEGVLLRHIAELNRGA